MKTRLTNSLLIMSFLLVLLGCHRITPADEVRKARREYDITYEFTVDQNNEVTYEVKVQNKSGGKNLQELTMLVEAFDQENKKMWSRNVEFDLTDLGNYATRSQIFKDTIPEAAEKLDAMRIVFAPDDEGSDWKTYKEFMRVL